MPDLAAVLELAAHYDAITVRLSPESLAAFLATFDALQAYQWDGASLDGLSTAEIDQIDNLVSTAFREIVTPYTMTSNPVGTIVAFAGTTAPAGWLLCDGAAKSRTTYSALFGVLGVLYGAGDGVATFNVPNLTGRVVSGAVAGGVGTGTSQPLGAAFGAEETTLAVSNIPPHAHNLRSSNGTLYYTWSGSGGGRYGLSPDSGLNAAATRLMTESTGGTGGIAAPFWIIQPSLAVNYMIYTGVE